MREISFIRIMREGGTRGGGGLEYATLGEIALVLIGGAEKRGVGHCHKMGVRDCEERRRVPGWERTERVG